VDTTVILAQPRVSRLRADAVYVLRRGSRGARHRIHGKHPGVPARRPPFSGLQIGELSETRDIAVGEIWPPKSRFFIVRNKTLSGNRVQIVIVFFTQNLLKIHRNFDFFWIFPPKSILFTRRPPAPPILRRSNALCKESIRYKMEIPPPAQPAARPHL